MKLTVIMADSMPTSIAITYENSWLPYKYRTVHVELTPEQIELLKPRNCGRINGTDIYESVSNIFLEE